MVVVRFVDGIIISKKSLIVPAVCESGGQVTFWRSKLHTCLLAPTCETFYLALGMENVDFVLTELDFCLSF